MKSIEKLPKSQEDTLAELTKEMPRLLEGFEIKKIRKTGKDQIVVSVMMGRTTRDLLVTVRTQGEPRIAMQAIMQMRMAEKKDIYPVFAAGFVTGSTRRLCKEQNVGYMDLVGNVYLRFDSVFVDRSGADTFKREFRGVKQLLAPKATRVIRALLSSDGPKTISSLATECGMSPAGVYWVMRLLLDKGFIERDEKKRIILVKSEELLGTWSGGWNMQKNSVFRYFSFERTPEDIIKKLAEFGKKNKLRYGLTLMAGSSLVAPFVRYEDVWAYVEDAEVWAKGLDLKPVDGGANVILVKPYDEGVFTGLQDINGLSVVSNIQLYVDLYNYPARGRQQAEFLKDKIKLVRTK